MATPEGHSAGRIYKRSFISTVISTVHTDPSRKRSLSNNIFGKLEESENSAFRFRVDGNTQVIKNAAF